MPPRDATERRGAQTSQRVSSLLFPSPPPPPLEVRPIPSSLPAPQRSASGPDSASSTSPRLRRTRRTSRLAQPGSPLRAPALSFRRGGNGWGQRGRVGSMCTGSAAGGRLLLGPNDVIPGFLSPDGSYSISKSLSSSLIFHHSDTLEGPGRDFFYPAISTQRLLGLTTCKADLRVIRPGLRPSRRTFCWRPPRSVEI